MKIVFAAGGTGGHINPALSAAGEVQRRYPDAEILFIGTADHMEARLVPAAGFAFKTIEIAGFQRKRTLKNIIKNIKTVGLLFKSTGEVKKILKHFAPDAVVGFGGYVSGPVLRTAAKMGIKTAIHEQNAYPGVTNKALAKTADAIMLTVEAAKAYKGKPTVIIAKTNKGRGVSFMQDNPGWHGKAPKEDEAKQAVTELGGEW